MPEQQKIRMAVIGDSLSQGFMSGAISQTTRSYPAIIADSIGLSIPNDFSVPTFPGSGLPFNIEEFLRFVEIRLGVDIQGWRQWLWDFPALYSEFVDRLEDLYERGNGSTPAGFSGSYHNLSVWGFRVHDSFSINTDVCEFAIRESEGFIQDDFLQLPSAPMYRTAKRVLNPGQRENRNHMTQVDALKSLIEQEGGLDVLILFLGSNDCLGTVLSLEVNDMEGTSSGDVPKNPIERRARFNLTSDKQFGKDFKQLVKRLDEILPEETKVFVGTIPFVTIPPVTRGIGTMEGRYFEYYARFFLTDGPFSPSLHKHLRREQIIAIDKRIESFNKTISEQAEDNDWTVVPTGNLLSSLAVRRQHLEGSPNQALRDYFASKGVSDHPLLRLNPPPSILKLETDELGSRRSGGLFSLDCVHPSTIGYGLLAELFLESMQKEGIPNADPRRINWARIIQQDRLLQSCPKTWDDLQEVASSNPFVWDTIFSQLG